MYLIQILLPLHDNAGKAFDAAMYAAVSTELTERFDGLTAYNRAPANGLWKSSSKKLARDKIVIFEVMAKQLDKSWWQQYREKLEDAFRQEHLIIRAQPVELV